MASAIEALGLSVPYSSSIPAWAPAANGGAGLSSKARRKLEKDYAARTRAAAARARKHDA